MPVITIPKLLMNNWRTQGQKQLINDCVWESLSNRVEVGAIIPNGDSKEIPDAVIHYVSSDFKKGVMFTNIPSFDKLKKRGGMGWEREQGNEETPDMRYARVYYNVERKSTALDGDDLDVDASAAYEIVRQAMQLLNDYFAELGDYNKQRALLEYATEALTETYAWKDSKTFSAPPVATRLHPTIYHKGRANKLPWVAPSGGAHTAAYNALATALLTIDAATKFEKQNLDAVVRIAQKHCIPLNWRSGDGQQIKWIAKMSFECWDMLLNSVDSKFSDLYTNADVRSVKNRAISGIMGVYRNVLMIVDPRAPVFNVLSKTFSYQKPWASVGSNGALFEEVERNAYTTTGNALSNGVSGVGATFECIQIMGRAAIGSARVKELKYNNDSFDYDFSKGTEARRACGDMREDFYVNGETEEPKNWSSALYFTPSPATTY